MKSAKNCFRRTVLSTITVLFISLIPLSLIAQDLPAKIINAVKTSPTIIDLTLSNQQHIHLDFYSDNIFRFFQDPAGGEMREPEAKPEAQILVDNPRRNVSSLSLNQNEKEITISTDSIVVIFDKATTEFKIKRKPSNELVLESFTPVKFDAKETVMKLKEYPQEYFYGGGVQNGRFSHKGKSISIENQNSWTDGGVASPNPFYWSTKGYGIMWYTFKKGKYDFGSKKKGVVKLSHQTNYLDVFIMVSQTPVGILDDFYQLTGNPVFIPKFGFYEGHLNAYNRDYWKKDSTGILFEDGNRYKESQKDNGGIKESLNGEKNNYQFSARAVIDRYAAHDLPFGWILPNDGYGAGYGQTSTIDSNIQNLKSFGDYARSKGVQIGLWTQSDLHPKKDIPALLQRDIVKEVGVAGVRVLKTDVAWVGPGYSFGLNGVADAAHIMSKEGNNARPFIITVDGWAGTQRYATVWSGDQTGGLWEYIRFHIPTYIGSGLSGQPNITSDMDGIFGGKNVAVNVRDFQWKTFTPMELNMDGWGANEKYPFALGEPATSINRMYLKIKSELIPYTYSIAKDAVDGKPIMRAMFLDYPNEYTHGTATKYQFLYGPYFLVAPIYQNTKADASGNDIRNGIYLPEGTWIDYFTGESYDGGKIINNIEAPLWKLPVFVKSGAIIPMTNPNNHVTELNKNIRKYEFYPAGNSSFTEYDDDGLTEAYKSGKGVTTLIESHVEGNTANLIIHPSQRSFDGFVKNKSTELIVNVTQSPKAITAWIGNKKITLKETKNKENFQKKFNTFYFENSPNLNRFSTKGSEFEKVKILKNPELHIRLEIVDITENEIKVKIEGYQFKPKNSMLHSEGNLSAPSVVLVNDTNNTAYTIIPSWSKVDNADYYEIEFQDMLYSTIVDTSLLFEDLQPETHYDFKIRAVNKSGNSDWKSFSAKTAVNPLEFAIKNISAQTSVPNQEDMDISQLFDFDESSIWHTKWSEKAVPFDIIIDLKSVNELDRMQYLPRDRGNGIWLKGTVQYSMNKSDWKDAGSFEWKKNGETKTLMFDQHPTARYLKIHISDAVGDYGSGRELYIFKVPGTESYLPGDINSDGKIDHNDLTSYMNYMGLRKGDADFEGYISKGDINGNGLIDAYDVSNVATKLEGGIQHPDTSSIAGKLEIHSDKKSYNKNEIAEVKVSGVGLNAVNALSFALPYDDRDFEYIGITPLNIKSMENMTNDRLHSNGQKTLYPTFVNVGGKETLKGSHDLFIIRLKAKRKVAFDLKPADVILVDQRLNSIEM